MRPLHSMTFEKVAAGLAAGLFVIVASAASAEETKEVKDTKIVAVVDQARLVKVPPGAQTLVIGNPTIADVTLLRKNNMMILTPKAFGQTNFIALDGDGNPVAESTIEVIGGTDSLIVQRGADRQSYSCAPRCQPTERLGDDDKYLSGVASQSQAHTQRLAGSPAPTSPGVAR